ncbi:MAG TPA: phage terminase small subunit P27 family [Rhodothermales bacterium]|nr:phage terminase small subunit P27 family [Rhodothermales bacterium]
MGKRGPRPKPTSLKVIQGTYRKDRASANEPAPEPVAPKCPTFLKGEARREWKRISAELVKLKLLAEIDRAALAAYCSNWETFVLADKIIREKGLTCLTPNGHEQQRPEIAIRNKAFQQMRNFLSEFGMTPASRSRISVPEERLDLNNPFAQLETGT